MVASQGWSGGRIPTLARAREVRLLEGPPRLKASRESGRQVGLAGGKSERRAALIETYGPPTEIVLELARQLKQNAKQKAEATRKNRENEAPNERRRKELEALGYPCLSGYRMMWLYVMFDLPVGTKAERKAATRFRNFLLDEGFEMAQFSVYLCFAESKEAADVFIGHIREALPTKGKVHIVTITDKQYGNARIFTGRKHEQRRRNPDQLALF